MVRWEPAAVAGVLLFTLAGAWAQSPPGIYTCIDAKGRRLTADRPIPECLDREQKVLGTSGTVREIVPPTPTAREREQQAELERRAAEEKARQAEARRAERALLARYPNQAAHDAQRARALQSANDATASIQRQLDDLHAQARKLRAEAAQHKDPAQVPPALKRQIEDNEQQVAAQQKALAGQREETQRLNVRFDGELARLKGMWEPPAAAVIPVSAPAQR